jgi:hypothetical protein
MLRRTRMAASILLLISAAILGGLWIRSYSWITNWQSSWGDTRTFQCVSKVGLFRFSTHPLETELDREDWPDVFSEYHKSERRFQSWLNPVGQSPATDPGSFEFGWSAWDRSTFLVYLPYWFAVFVCILLAAALSLRRPTRFALRTFFFTVTVLVLLFGTTVVVSRLPSPRPKPSRLEDIEWRKWLPESLQSADATAVTDS